MATNSLIRTMTSLSTEKPEFVSVGERNKCLICHEILQVPMMTQCGHRMCKNCLDEYMENHGREPFPCPANLEDCVDFTESELLPDFGTYREIIKLDVYCSNRKQGCKTVVPWVKLKDHLALCPYTLEDCTNKGFGCTAKVSKLNLKKHLDSECQFRTKQCPHCGVFFLETLLPHHIHNECPLVSIICPFKCGEQSIQRSKLEDHKKVCCAKPQDCQYKDAGCQFSGTEDEVKQHDAQCVNEHLKLMHKKMGELSGQNQMLTSKLEKLENERVTSSSQFPDVMPKINMIEKRLLMEESTMKATQKLVAAMNVNTKNHLTKEEMLSVKDTVKSLETQLNTIKQSQTDSSKVESLERDLTMINIRLQEMDLRLQCVETASFDGVLIWKIRDYSRRKADAVSGKTLSLYSQPFYTSRYGYKGCARVYLNGDGMGKGTHMSLFFVLLRGDFDALLQWPFRQKITLTLLDQEGGKKNVVDSFHTDPTSKSFKRPTSDMNIASGCPLFVSQSVVESKTFLKDDCIFLKIQIEKRDHGM